MLGNIIGIANDTATAELTQNTTSLQSIPGGNTRTFMMMSIDGITKFIFSLNRSILYS